MTDLIFYEWEVNAVALWLDFCSLLRYIFLVKPYKGFEKWGSDSPTLDPLQMF